MRVALSSHAGTARFPLADHIDVRSAAARDLYDEARAAMANSRPLLPR